MNSKRKIGILNGNVKSLLLLLLLWSCEFVNNDIDEEDNEAIQ